MKISLKAARVNAGLTQKEAARRASVASLTLINWEKERTAPTIVQLLNLCKIYGVELDDLILPEKLV